MPIHRRFPTSCGVPPAPAPSQHPAHTPASRTTYRMAAAHRLSRTAAAVGGKRGGQVVGGWRSLDGKNCSRQAEEQHIRSWHQAGTPQKKANKATGQQRT